MLLHNRTLAKVLCAVLFVGSIGLLQGCDSQSVTGEEDPQTLTAEEDTKKLDFLKRSTYPEPTEPKPVDGSSCTYLKAEQIERSRSFSKFLVQLESDQAMKLARQVKRLTVAAANGTEKEYEKAGRKARQMLTNLPETEYNKAKEWIATHAPDNVFSKNKDSCSADGLIGSCSAECEGAQCDGGFKASCSCPE